MAAPRQTLSGPLHWKAKAPEAAELEVLFENGGADAVSVSEVAPSLGRSNRFQILRNDRDCDSTGCKTDVPIC